MILIVDQLIKAFEHIVDVRDSRGKRHNLVHMMVMSVCGILHGYHDFEEICDYALAHEDWFHERLDLWNGIPCARTLNNVFRLIPADEFLTAFLTWINQIVKDKTGSQVILDGKAIRAATDKAHNGNIPYIVSAYLADLGLSIGQVKVEEKSNEITAIPALLDLLILEGCIITIDAIGTQEKIMDKIKKKKAEFVLPLKENQRGTYVEVKKYYQEFESTLQAIVDQTKSFEYSRHDIGPDQLDIYVHRERAHGRKTERIYVKSSRVEWIQDEKFKHVACVVQVISHTTVHDHSVRYYVSSVDLPVEELAKLIRNHWQIENNLHWTLDMYFHEDLSRVSKDYALENLALLRKLCYNILKLDKRYDRVNKNGNLVRMSLKRKMNRYTLYPQEFEELLYSVLPNLKL